MFDFFLDIGCFQGRDTGQRHSEGNGITALANPEATVRRVWGRFTGGMFVSGEVRPETGFADACAGLAYLMRAGGLLDASREAYGLGMAGLAQLASPGSVGGMSRLVAAHSRDLAGPGDWAGLALRWEADPSCLALPAPERPAVAGA